MTRARILYLEVPDFYAAVERAGDPSLRDRPILVGGDPRRRGRVQCATPAAARAGVELGMPMLEALERCPRARALRTDMRRYREVSTRLRTCLWGEVEALEPAGLAGAFVEAPPRRAPALAARLIQRVDSELGLPLQVGIADLKFLARLAAEAAEPGAARLIPPGEERDFLRLLPVSRLPGVGPNTAARLSDLGARTAGELLQLDRERLEAELGNHGLHILELARGRDDAPVRAAKHPQSLSQEHTFERPQRDLAVLAGQVQALCEALEKGLRHQGLRARGVALRLRYADRTAQTRSQTLKQPLEAAADIAAAAQALLARTDAGVRPARGLGISLSRLSRTHRDERQIELFPEPR